MKLFATIVIVVLLTILTIKVISWNSKDEKCTESDDLTIDKLVN
jgi:hypothetical protein